MKAFNAKSVLGLSVSLMFLGRAIQHLFLQVSYNDIFWNQELFGSVVNLFWGVTWNDFLTNLVIQAQLDLFVRGIGVVFLIGSIAPFFVQYKWARISVLSCVGLLLPQLWFHFVGLWYNWAMLFEFSAQLMVSLLFLMVGANNEKWVKCGLVTIVLTFVCHGLYAVGLFPVPQKFVAMTIRTFHCNREAALMFLRIAGVLDFIVATLLFVPNKRVVKLALLYMVVWGFATAFARWYTHFYWFDAWRSTFQWISAFLIRTPHFLIPLALLSVRGISFKTDRISLI